MSVRPAAVEDAGEILTVQRAAFVSEAQLNERADLPPLTETLAEVTEAVVDPDVLVLVAERPGPRGPRLVGSARVRLDPATATAYVGRIAAAPDLQGTGIGSALLSAAERSARERWPAAGGLRALHRRVVDPQHRVVRADGLRLRPRRR